LGRKKALTAHPARANGHSWRRTAPLPFPLTAEGLPELHASALETYLVCPRRYFMQHVCGLVPKQVEQKLFVGGLVHAGVAAFNTPDAPVDAVRIAMNAYIDENLSPERQKERADDIALAHKLLDAYAIWAPSLPFRVVAAERPFALRLRNPDTGYRAGAVVAGTLDAQIVPFEGKQLPATVDVRWPLEYKTVRNAMDPLVLHMVLQFGVYAWASREMFPEMPVAGLVLVQIRKVDPARARKDVIVYNTITFNDTGLASVQRLLYALYRRILAERDWLPRPVIQVCSWRCRGPYIDLCEALSRGTQNDVDYIVENAFAAVTPAAEEPGSQWEEDA